MVLSNGDVNYAFFTLIDRGHRLGYTLDAVVRHPFSRTLDEFRVEYLQARTVGAAYLTFLFFEAPRHRAAVLRYLVESLRGVPRVWRGQSAAHRICG